MSNNTRSKNQRRSGRSGGGDANPNARGGDNGQNNGGGRNGDKGRNTNSRRRKGGRKKKVDPKVFWGDVERLAEVPNPNATITAKPSAVVQSLGRPPLSGQQNASEHYFAAVYDRAVNLAAALAAAGNLIEPEDLTAER